MKTDGALCILYLLIFGCTGALGDITCKATTNEQETTVECSFGDNIGTTKSNFNVQFYYPTLDVHPETKLMCNWMSTGSMKCKLGPGVEFDEVVSDKLTIRGPPAVDKVGGMYVCQVVPRSTSPVHPCNLTRVEATTTAAPLCCQRDDSKTALTLSIVSIVLVGLFLICFCGCKVKTRIFKTARTDEKEPQNTQPGRGIEIPLESVSEVEVAVRNTTDGGPKKRRSWWQRLRAFFGIGAAGVSQNNPENAEGASTKLLEGQSAQPRETGRAGEGQPQIKSEVGQGVSKAGTPPAAPPKPPAPDTRPLQILVIGKVKTGKSLLANNIIGEDRFKVGSTRGRPTTKVPGEHTATISGRDVKVVDTSSLHTPTRESKQQKVDQWKAMTALGPRAILFLVRCDKMEDEDYTFYTAVKKLWGDGSFCRRLIVVLTFSDKLGRTSVEEKLDETKNKHLKTIIAEAGDRYIPVDNVAENKEKPDYFGLIDDKIKQLV